MRNKKYYLYVLIFGLLIVVFGFGKEAWAEDTTVTASEQTEKQAIISVKYDKGLLNADIQSATIKEIFDELKKNTGMSYEIEKEILEKKVTIKFKDKELVQGIKDILNSIGNPSYMLSYKKNNKGRYEVARVKIEKTGKGDSSPGALAKGEMEIGFVDGKYRIRTKDVDVNELLEKLSNIAGMHDKIIADKINRKIDFEGGGENISNILKYDMFGEIRPKIYKVVWVLPERDRNNKIIKPGYNQITKMTGEEIRHRREQAELKNAEGERLLQQERYMEAKTAFEDSAGTDKDYFKSRINLAKLHIFAGQGLFALKSLNEAAEIRSEAPEIYLYLGQAHQQDKQIDLALENYKKYIKLSQDIEGKKNISNIIKGLETEENKAYYTYLRQGEDFYKQNKIKEAEKSYKKALGIKPDSKDAKVILGKFYGNTAKHKEAVKIFQGLIKKYPEDYENHMLLGITYRGMGKYGEAIEEMKKGKELVKETGIKENIDFMIKQIKEYLKEETK